MNVQHSYRRKALIIPVIIVLSLVGIYTAASLLLFEVDPLLGLLDRTTDQVLLLHERTANRFLHWTGSRIQIDNHAVMLDGTAYETVRSGTLMRKWIALLLLLTWVFPASTIKKLWFSGLVLVLNFLMSPLTIALQAYLAGQGVDLYSQTRISRTAAHLMNMTLLFAWLRYRREELWKFLSIVRLDSSLIRRKSTAIVTVSYVYLILGYFMLGWFEFTPWVNFLFNQSQRILSWFGIESVVESQLLIGKEGSLSMLKSCLGLNTMLLFAALIFLMGENSLRSWIYILAGLLILNAANIMRLVLLFMHVQKHGTYVGVMDYHDLYDYIIYGLVFLLWVIWFEKFSRVRILAAKRQIAEEKRTAAG